jgi:hypothetical protein
MGAFDNRIVDSGSSSQGDPGASAPAVNPFFGASDQVRQKSTEATEKQSPLQLESADLLMEQSRFSNRAEAKPADVPTGEGFKANAEFALLAQANPRDRNFNAPDILDVVDGKSQLSTGIALEDRRKRGAA